ncbi:MAG: carboxypeptidase-like regulatory domain-containing protein, partial [Saprospiraceae bacterium]
MIFAQNFTLSGYIKDAETGEDLIEANIYAKENPNIGTSTNIYGFYSISMEKGTYTFVVSYLGYVDQEIKITLESDQRLNIELSQGIAFKEVVVTAEAADKNVQSTEMGTIEMDMEQLKNIPALLGEADVFKALQLMPGVQSAGEGNSG